MIIHIKIIEPHEIRIYETHSPITRSKHFYIFHCPISQIALSLVSNCTQYMFTLYKHVLTLLPRYTFRNGVKILGKNRKFQTEINISNFTSRNKHMYDLERKDSSTNFSFFLETRKRGEKKKTQQRVPLNYTGICDNGNGGNERNNERWR